MKLNKAVNINNEEHQNKMPWKPMIGFVVSIILASLALWTLFYTDSSTKLIPAAVSGLAFIQAILQLRTVSERQQQQT